MAVWSLLLQGDSEGPSFISRTASRSRIFLTQLHPGFQRDRPVAGYDYGIDWTPTPAGLSPAGMTTSFAAPRDVFFDPGRATAPRITAPLMLRSTITTASAPAMRQFRGSIDTPCNCCVRFVAVVTAGSRNTHYRATRYGLTRAGLSPAGPRQPYWRLRLCCPGPSTLNRPHPPHSQAHHNFIVRGLICAAFAVRERLGDPRVVPHFSCLIFPSMSSSTSPGSRSLHPSSSFATRTCLHREPSGSALPTLSDVGAYWIAIATTC
jgi:hypothetical protein